MFSRDLLTRSRAKERLLRNMPDEFVSMFPLPPSAPMPGGMAGQLVAPSERRVLRPEYKVRLLDWHDDTDTPSSKLIERALNGEAKKGWLLAGMTEDNDSENYTLVFIRYVEDSI